MTNKEDFILHYGVKGMKWGVRRKRGPDGTVTGKKKSRVRREIGSRIDELKTIKKLNTSKMTDDELKNLATRMQKENELKRLTNPGKLRTRKRLEKRDIYLDRKNLSDAELESKLKRLRLEDQIKRNVKDANRGSIDVANDVINKVSKHALSMYTNDGKFSPTGNPMYDTLIKAVLTQTKEGKVIK